MDSTMPCESTAKEVSLNVHATGFSPQCQKLPYETPSLWLIGSCHRIVIKLLSYDWIGTTENNGSYYSLLGERF